MLTIVGILTFMGRINSCSVELIEFFLNLDQTWGITLESNALNKHYLPKMCIKLALALLDFEKVMN